VAALALAIVTFASGVLVLVGSMALLGRLHRNFVAGIRTRYALASDENWDRTHRAAAPLLIFGGVAGLMAGLAFLPFAAAGVLSNGVAFAACLAIAILLAASAIVGWLVGSRSARAGAPSPT
jgi:uncharacterized membrane protein